MQIESLEKRGGRETQRQRERDRERQREREREQLNEILKARRNREIGRAHV